MSAAREAENIERAMGKRIGLVGCGNWGKHVLRDLTALGCHTTVVGRSEATRANASAYSAPVVSTPEELPEVDGIVITTPSSTHASMIDRVLGRGVPVYTEKPFTTNLKDAERLARAGDGRLFVMHKWRYHPGVLALARLASSGALGRVHGLRTLRCGHGVSHDDVDVIWHLAPHDLSIALEILGPLPPLRYATADWQCAEVAGCLAAFGSHDDARESPSLVLEVSNRYPEHRREVRLLCEQGVAILAGAYADSVIILRSTSNPERLTPRPTLESAGSTSSREVVPIDGSMPLLSQLEAFVHFLSGGPPPKSSAREGLEEVRAVVEICRQVGAPTSR